ncbi:hypothetical protein P7C71_g6476, partial [Lecanoromycetidae sp. Uapishka_2]
MARTKRSASKSAIASAPPATLPALSPAPSSNFPAQLRFPLLVVLSMVLSSILYSVASPFTSGDLATVSRSHDEWWEVTGLLGWKAAQLAVGCIKTPKGVAANRTVINDYGVQASTSVFAAGIYGVIVSASYATWLPEYLINHFDGIRDISILHNSNFTWLMASYLPIGFAAKVFIFTPSTAAKPDAYDKEIARFNPETATLGETVMYNLWGFSKRTRTLIKRTATIVAVSGMHTWFQTYVSLEGAELFGAVGWSSVWATAAVWTGVAFWWVGDVKGMSN